MQQSGSHKSEAIYRQCMSMIEANPNDPRPYCALAGLAQQNQHHAKALELLQNSARLAPHDVFYQVELAKGHLLAGHRARAIQIATKAAMAPVTEAAVAYKLGVIFSQSEVHHDALKWYRLAAKFAPHNADYHFSLANAAQILGKTQEADEAYQAVLKIDPDNYRAIYGAGLFKPQTLKTITKLKSKFQHYTGNAEAQLYIGHAIAKAYEDIGHMQASLSWLTLAKSAKKALIEYDVNDDIAIMEAAKNTITLGHDKSSANTSSTIFIVGLPRTGTTLVDRILSSHPDVVSGGELNDMSQLVKKASKTQSSNVIDAETLSMLRDKSVTHIGHDYINDTDYLRGEAKLLTDKMPLNFFYAAIILRALPNARIVALRRGAMDSCLSNYRQLFATRHKYYNYAYDLKDLATYYQAYDSLMTHWRNNLPANRFTEIHYEDIVTDQEVQTRKLLQFCGLAWNERCLKFYDNTSPVATPSAAQVRQPLFTSSIGRWKKYDGALSSLKEALGDLAAL